VRRGNQLNGQKGNPVTSLDDSRDPTLMSHCLVPARQLRRDKRELRACANPTRPNSAEINAMWESHASTIWSSWCTAS
jgi:hypothetical protein